MLLRGVAASGNRNWGANFGRAGDIICEQYCVPLIVKFELAGNENEVQFFNDYLKMSPATISRVI
ncbi:hypothetical protein PghCCS26_47470 [Paenibacillus glycanilyticus]|uniref:Uncharacterized protein n=1 Tax=Paenibacillus glycanilyticus TaxID=126569 RepID=A0ABQ6NTR8_9BACL|nr:hypothetical protein PghCCS26_47470 [Paenibacillus glycanilyticus]